METKHLNENMPDSDAEFAADALEDAEKIVQDMLAGVDGFREVDMAGSKQDIALGHTSEGHAIYPVAVGQPSHEVFFGLLKIGPARKGCDANLSAKSKKIMIEIRVVEAKNIKVTCKLFMVSTRVSGRYALVASINGNCELP